MRFEREAGKLDAERRRSAWTPWVRPTQRSSRVRARAREHGTSSARAGQDRLAHGPQRQRQRRVEHVGGGQAEVDPATGSARVRGEHVHESGDVMVGDALAFGDGLDGDGAARIAPGRPAVGPSPSRAATASPGRRRPRPSARSPSGPRRSRSRRSSDGCSARSRSIMCAVGASSHGQRSGSGAENLRGEDAALRALFRPTHATGTPGGICSTDRIASSPPAPAAVSTAARRSPADRCAPPPRPAAPRRSRPPRSARAARACAGTSRIGHRVGLAVGGDHADLVQDAAASELGGGPGHRLHVALGAHQDADQRRVATRAAQRRPRAAARHSPRALRSARMQRYRCAAGVPSNSTMPAAAYAAAQAEARSTDRAPSG